MEIAGIGDGLDEEGGVMKSEWKGKVKEDKLIIGPFIEMVKAEGDPDLEGTILVMLSLKCLGDIQQRWQVDI